MGTGRDFRYPIIEGGIKFPDLPAAKWGQGSRKEDTMTELYPSFSQRKGEVFRTFIEPDTGNLAAEVWTPEGWVHANVEEASWGHTIDQHEAERLVGGPVWPREGEHGL